LKLVRYRVGRKQCYGALLNDEIVSLPELAKHSNISIPERLEDFIALGVEGIQKAENMLKQAVQKDLKSISAKHDEVCFLAPMTSPPKIICMGLNYRDHVSEQKTTIPDEPVIFMKPRTTIIGPNENIVKPSFVKQLDYEAELAIVMGKEGKNIPVSEASVYIFGYTILNDVSARDIQFKDKQWTRGKSFDTFAPTGPCITTVNQLQNTSNLSIKTWVNDEIRQNSTTQNMIFNVCQIVHHISRVMTLEPCDIIATGTPAGVGFAMKPQPKFLQSGDTVRIEIEGIGTLQNRIIEEEADA
jgi:2-keto-4-pentenoate hydratase/2-oxohepta-3-ene-1,7-dioic acid hydratase in catechol pathway